MKIKVTQEHIDNGIPCRCLFCPIALAIREQTNKFVKVSSKYIEIQGNVINLSITAHGFIKDFDKGRIVKPFEFELDYNL